ncbi:NnrS family protein [Thermomonas sp.]|uniref:NnrS family protein n=1 Tax=Thermomonas sp. TaxID=1971895 RepID=UPI002630550B|nr:NnrS family protein [Thermomonas sp.]
MNTPAQPQSGAGFSFALLAVKPHRILFFAGALNVLLAMSWWLLWLIDTRWHLIGLPGRTPYGGWVHAFVMQYQLFPPFMFGFLLTTFPRWMGFPDLRRAHYLPVGLGLLGGQVLVIAGMLTGFNHFVHLGVVLSILGWGYGLIQLLRVLLAERRAGKGPTWHAWSCFTALGIGWIGLLLMAAFLHGVGPWAVFVSIKLGTFAVLLPVYSTVAHRMFPFFAGNVVPGYRPWRPLGLLAALWGLLLAHLALELTHENAWMWPVDAAMALGSAYVLYRWWPRGKSPGILWVLFAGFAWLPVAFTLFAIQSAALATGGEFILGRGPQHAIYIGFFGSLLVAMVTRVTQGHSGRPIEMPAVGWFAFALLQLVALTRIAAEAAPDTYVWQTVAAAGWLIAFLPWALRSLSIYLHPRADGKPG